MQCTWVVPLGTDVYIHYTFISKKKRPKQHHIKRELLRHSIDCLEEAYYKALEIDHYLGDSRLSMTITQSPPRRIWNLIGEKPINGNKC